MYFTPSFTCDVKLQGVAFKFLEWVLGCSVLGSPGGPQGRGMLFKKSPAKCALRFLKNLNFKWKLKVGSHSNDGDYSSCYAYEMEWTLTASLSAALLANKGLIYEVPQKSSQNSSSWMLSCVEEKRMINRSDDCRCNRQFEVAMNEIDRKQSMRDRINRSMGSILYPYMLLVAV